MKKNIFFLVWNFFLPFKFLVCLVIQISKDHISSILQPKRSIFWYTYDGVSVIAYQLTSLKEDRQNIDWISKKYDFFRKIFWVLSIKQNVEYWCNLGNPGDSSSYPTVIIHVFFSISIFCNFIFSLINILFYLGKYQGI